MIEKLSPRQKQIIFRSSHTPHSDSPIQLAKDALKIHPTTSRLEAIFHLIGYFKPGFEKAAGEKVSNTSRFPFRSPQGEGFEHIGSGGEQDVFRIGSNVLKVDSASLGKSNDELETRVQQFKNNHARLKEIFKELPNFVPHENFLILNSHIDHLPAVATVAQYVEGEKYEVFSKNTMLNEKFEQLLAENPGLKTEFTTFASITSKLYDSPEKKELLDVLGEDNLLAVKNNDGVHLVFIDGHDIKSIEEIKAKNLPLLPKYEARMQFLRQYK